MLIDPIPAVLAAIPLPLILVASDERVAFANAQAETIFAKPLQGRHYVAVLRHPALLDAIESALRSGQAFEAEYQGSEGSRDITYLVRAVPAADQGVLVSFQDLTPLQEAGNMRRDFVANVSHELRTPLTALLGFIETIAGAARDDPPARDRFLAIMRSEAERMNRLVQDLLSLSRVEDTERLKPTGRVEVRGLLQSAITALQPAAEQNKVTIEADLDGQPLHIAGEADQLRQVFSNLLENAVKYGAKPGIVRVRLTESDPDPTLRAPACRIDIQDDGEGIDPLHIPRLTERFYRVDTHRSREMGGTGLGLAIVKHIVNRHRGRLRIASEPGQGSVFSVILPKS